MWDVKLPQRCLSDLIYLAAAVWDLSFTQSWVTFGWISSSTYCIVSGTLTPGASFFFSLLKDPQCDCDPVRWLCGLVPPPCWDDWARLSLTHCETFPVRLPRTAFTHRLSLNTTPCAKMGNAGVHKEKPLQWRVSCVPEYIYQTNMATGNHNRELWWKFSALQTQHTFTTHTLELCASHIQ